MAVDLKRVQPGGIASMWVLAAVFMTVGYGVTANIAASTGVVGPGQTQKEALRIRLG